MKCKTREELRFWEAVYIAWLAGGGGGYTEPRSKADTAVEARRLREPEPEHWAHRAPFRDPGPSER